MLCLVWPNVALLASAFSFGVYTASDLRVCQYLYCRLRTTACWNIVQSTDRACIPHCTAANLLETYYSIYDAMRFSCDRHRSPYPVPNAHIFRLTNYHLLQELPSKDCLSFASECPTPVDESVPCRWRDPQYKHISTSWLLGLSMARTSMSSPEQ